jgi:hypothetical protein
VSKAAAHDEAARRTGHGAFELRAHCLRWLDAEDDARRALPALVSA